MKRILSLAVVFSLVILLSGCDAAYTKINDVWANNHQIDDLQTQIDNLDLALNTEYIDDNFYTNTEIDEGFEDVLIYIQQLELQIEQAQERTKELEIYVDIVTGNHYAVDIPYYGDLTCYNDMLFYQIVNEDLIKIMFMNYQEIGIFMILNRNTNDNFYITFIGRTDGTENTAILESYEVSFDLGVKGTAVDYMYSIISEQVWTTYQTQSDWERLKLEVQ